ncbi:hypothetical protein [Acidianus bottle-shaped virus 2 strain ABV2]|uniref:Uncharacterized protein n=1 Tax=Acidianus bottle-shaped virus 2 strain ABV2 TaxID=1732173 RepID=A0A0N9P4H9_9VIRU|nr:hypothetical protein AVU01_gp51 [Acidianus bottle-shaped virus 2 strain ABV2]ALG96799.1 hypothetical protein [Acidianus bottle-shaped virus 2 strain ABV2]
MGNDFSSPSLDPYLLDALEHYSKQYKYVVDQFEFGKAKDPYDAIDYISGLMKVIKDVANEDFVEERIETLRTVYFQLGKVSDNIVWNYEVHRYYEPEKVLSFIEEMNSVIEKTYGRKLG